MMDLIPEFQQNFTDEVKGNTLDTNFLIWTNEMGKELKRELLAIRIKCRNYVADAAATQKWNSVGLRRCPYCTNVWVLVEGCVGTTACGALPSGKDTNRPANVWKWNWKSWFSTDQGQTKKFDWKTTVSAETRIAKGGNKASVGKSPELIKPCLREIAWKDMAPVYIPADWNLEVSETVTDVSNLIGDAEKKLAADMGKMQAVDVKIVN